MCGKVKEKQCKNIWNISFHQEYPFLQRTNIPSFKNTLFSKEQNFPSVKSSIFSKEQTFPSVKNTLFLQERIFPFIREFPILQSEQTTFLSCWSGKLTPVPQMVTMDQIYFFRQPGKNSRMCQTGHITPSFEDSVTPSVFCSLCFYFPLPTFTLDSTSSFIFFSIQTWHSFIKYGDDCSHKCFLLFHQPPRIRLLFFY